MSKTTTIDTPEGTVTIDSKLFQGYNSEALGILDQIAELNKDFKEVVETVSETTKLKKSRVSKYFKARFKESTKESKVEGDLFEALDEAIA